VLSNSILKFQLPILQSFSLGDLGYFSLGFLKPKKFMDVFKWRPFVWIWGSLLKLISLLAPKKMWTKFFCLFSINAKVLIHIICNVFLAKFCNFAYFIQKVKKPIKILWLLRIFLPFFMFKKLAKFRLRHFLGYHL
jgi:hypothetical protein